MNKCRICGNEKDNPVYSVREMMFGIDESFDYFECSICGCLQIAEIPADPGKYYPGEYYSYKKPRLIAGNPVKRFFKRLLTAHIVGRKNPVGWLLSKLYPSPNFAVWMKKAFADLDDAIIDVGCGLGELLLNMESLGFTNLTGSDPYIAQDISYSPRLRILKRELDDIEGEFDVVMLHHSFEHMLEPHHAFGQIRRLLKPGKTAILRVPLASSYSWRTYRANWVAIDAPRHIYLHTESSIGLLAEKYGFELVEIEYDSRGFQFWGSELYSRGITLTDERSPFVNRESSIFSAEELKSFRERAQELNAKGDGDTACFYLRKSG